MRREALTGEGRQKRHSPRRRRGLLKSRAHGPQRAAALTARPKRRLLFRIFLPDFVFMRARKPIERTRLIRLRRLQ
jgi:hypothetical protein